jgi:hypothetical protein
MLKLALTALVTLLFTIPAIAQTGGSTIYTPGQPPTQVVPSYGGGSTIYTPGQPPTQVVPSYGGGSTIYTPGHPPTQVVPR